MLVKFTKDYRVKAQGGESYARDEVHDLPEESARHFINKGVAAEHQEEKDRRGTGGKPKTLVRKESQDEGGEKGKAEGDRIDAKDKPAPDPFKSTAGQAQPPKPAAGK